jgi:hypothetical protein
MEKMRCVVCGVKFDPEEVEAHPVEGMEGNHVVCDICLNHEETMKDLEQMRRDW